MTLDSAKYGKAGGSEPWGLHIHSESTSEWIVFETFPITICGTLGILRARLIPKLLVIPRNDNYVLDAESKYNVYGNNNALSTQIPKKGSQKAEILNTYALMSTLCR